MNITTKTEFGSIRVGDVDRRDGTVLLTLEEYSATKNGPRHVAQTRIRPGQLRELADAARELLFDHDEEDPF